MLIALGQLGSATREMSVQTCVNSKKIYVHHNFHFMRYLSEWIGDKSGTEETSVSLDQAKTFVDIKR